MRTMLLTLAVVSTMFTVGFSQEAEWQYVTESSATRFYAKPVAQAIQRDKQTIDICLKATYQKAQSCGAISQTALWRFDFKTERFALKEDIGYDEAGIVVYHRVISDDQLNWQTPALKSIGAELYGYARSLYDKALRSAAL